MQARGDALGLGARAGGRLLGPVRSAQAPAARGGRGAQADEPRQHLAGDAGRALLDPVEDDLGQHHAGDVLARLLVHDPHVLAGGDQAGDVLDGDVAPGRRRRTACGCRSA